MLHFVGPAPDLFSTCTTSFKPRLAPLMISISSELLGSTSSILSKKKLLHILEHRSDLKLQKKLPSWYNLSWQKINHG